MNTINLIGRLTRDVELRTTEAGTSRGTFSLAINRPNAKEGLQDVDFIPCVAWNKTAENLHKYQGKGNQISVEGTLRADWYTDKDGNNKTIYYVLANRIEYLSKVEKTEEQKKEEDPFTEFANEIELTDEDLPF